MRICTYEGNNDCVLTARATNGCAAMAASDTAVSGGVGPTKDAAEQDALNRNGGGTIRQRGLCSTDDGVGPSPFSGTGWRFDRAAPVTPGGDPADDPATEDGAALTATVNSDVDLYDEPGGSGEVIGVMLEGEQVELVEACRDDNWCNIQQGWVWGDFLTLG